MPCTAECCQAANPQCDAKCCGFWARRGNATDTPRGRNHESIRTAEEAIMRSKERLDKRAQIAAAEEEVRQAKERLDALKKREHTAAFFDAAARGDTEAAQDSHDAALAG